MAEGPLNTPGLMRAVPSGGSLTADLEMVARCRRGDGSAWRVLYDRYAPIVYRFLAAFGVPNEEREDACQEVFVAVYRSLARFRGEARLSTWIYRIAARHAGRIARRRRVRGLLSTLLVREPPPPPTPDPSERRMMPATCLASSRLNEGLDCASVTVDVAVPREVVTTTGTVPVAVSSGVCRLICVGLTSQR